MTTIVAPPGGNPVPSQSETPVAGALTKRQLLNAVLAFTRHELFQSRVVVAVVFFVCVVAIFVLRWGYVTYGSGGFSGYNVLISSDYDLIITCIFPIGGFLLGILQPHADRHFDLWAFLVHRPVPRWTRSVGRMTAGLTLYALVLGIPLACMLCYAASTSGGVIFYWRFILPSVAAFTTGVVYYFSGLLIAERKAMIYGSKMIPLFAAIMCSALTRNVETFWFAMLVNFGFITLLAEAALGANISHGYVNRSPLLSRVATSAILVLAFSAVTYMPAATISAGLSGTVWNVLQEINQYSGSGPSNIKRRIDFELLSDGRFAKRIVTYSNKYEKTQYGYERLRYEELRDMQDRPLSLESVVPNSQDISQFYFQRPDDYQVDVQSYRQLDSLFSNYEHRGESFNVRDGTEYWFLIYPERLFYGYFNSERTGRQFVGTIGKNGFSTDKAEPFSDVISYGDPIVGQHNVWVVDFRTHSIKSIFQTPPDEPILTTHQKGSGYPPTEDNEFAFVTSKRIILYDLSKNTVRAAFPLTHDPNDFRIILQYFKKLQRFIVRYNEVEKDGMYLQHPWFYEAYDLNARLLEHNEFPSRVTFEPPLVVLPPKPIEPEIWQLVTIDGIILGVIWGFCSPVTASFAFLFWIPISRGPYAVIDPNVPIQMHGFVIGLLAIALLSGADAWRLAIRYRTGCKPLWALLTFLFGPAMLLTMACTHSRPVRLKCAACGKLRAVDQESCPHCGAFWSPPTPTGTEILGLS